MMRNRGISLLQIIAIFLLATKSALAIKCYNCDSTKNRECIDVSSSNTIIPETCTPQKLSTADPNSSSWLQKLIRIDIYSNNPYNVAMICQKISVVNDVDPEDRIIVRSCQVDGAQTDPCSVATDKIRDQQLRGYKIEHCSVCNRDNCNGAMGLAKMWSPMAILLVMMIFARTQLCFYTCNDALYQWWKVIKLLARRT
ncbi:uncharacterized protein LOC129808090 [Phlebotomus papatasi]|uniref:uncharacterized protein LOC129808090 n=1 Tax=Phlebotomus papatasi TaxID=29031 RepID=UPI002483C2C2|nr:uncharacterized protein LOC129808090 [Phlebotomus papatasi]